MKHYEPASMESVKALTKFLIDTWLESKCPGTDTPAYACAKCQFNGLCAKIDELAKVVNR